MVPFDLDPGLGLDVGRVRVSAFSGEEVRWQTGTVFGIVTEGRATLTWDEDDYPLRPGMFFVAPGPGAVRGGRGLLIVDAGPVGLFQIGGPVESAGRLRYIDGCTDTLLVCPPRLGDPSLNHLHIPAGTFQTSHHHTSDRIGVILRGAGTCHTPDRTFPLSPGMGWWIPANAKHCFATGESSLDVLAWHPDSVFGPSDEVHPMKTGTLIG
jgi:mannose-6-phosphate isomerase-like protein (cupin superfamily)